MNLEITFRTDALFTVSDLRAIVDKLANVNDRAEINLYGPAYTSDPPAGERFGQDDAIVVSWDA